MRRKLLWALGAVLVFSLLAGFLLPALLPAHEHINPTRCSSNLKQIGYACHLYAGDNHERFPPSLGALFPKQISDGDVFLCPVARKAKEITLAELPEGAADASAVWHGGFTDYVYVEGLSCANKPDFVLAYDKEGNHSGGRLVLLIDGRVQWMKEPEFRSALARTRAFLAGRRPE